MPRSGVEHRARQHHVISQAARTTSKPVYGNFQRYYHIRNPANSAAAGERHAPDQEHSSPHPAVALDSRVAAILSYLSAQQAPPPPTSPVDADQVPRVLDIGCNSGKLTIQLAQTLPLLLRKRMYGSSSSALHRQMNLPNPFVDITGVDIDPSLIQQAKEATAVARSLYRPKQLGHNPSQHRGVVAHERLAPLRLPSEAVFFPSVFPSLFGTLQSKDGREAEPRISKRQKTHTDNSSLSNLPSHIERGAYDDPSVHLSSTRLRFLAAEWVEPETSSASPFQYHPRDLSELIRSDTRGYTMILALSLTKWIHIQQSDSGLVRFFARIACTLLPEGLLFLERQEWRSYHSAKNLDPTIKRKIKTLQMRPEGDFDWILESVGLRLVEQEIGRGVGVGFVRTLQVFRKLGKGEVGGAEAGVVRRQLSEGDQFAWVARSPAGAT